MWSANSFLSESTVFRRKQNTILIELPPLKLYQFPLSNNSIVAMDTLPKHAHSSINVVLSWPASVVHVKLIERQNKSTLKGKNLFPRGANSFLLESTIFSREPKTILIKLLPLKLYQFPLSNYSIVAMDTLPEHAHSSINVVLSWLVSAIHVKSPL